MWQLIDEIVLPIFIIIVMAAYVVILIKFLIMLSKYVSND